jgi:hypothetical protein
MFSHMMVFAFFVLCSFVYFLCHKNLVKYKKTLLVMLLPYVLLFCFFMMFSRIEHPLYAYHLVPTIWGDVTLRFTRLPWLVFPGSYTPPWGYGYNPGIYNLVSIIALFVSAMAVPFILGYKFSKNPTAYAVMISFLFAWLLLPSEFRGVAQIYERFPLFLVPAYILCFTDENIHSPARSGGVLPKCFFVMLISALMFYPLSNLYFFKAESDEFNSLIDDLPKNKRALMLMYELTSKRVKVPVVFIHFPLWYQALKGGWVEYNTAGAYVAPVRYLPDKLPESQVNEWQPEITLSLQHCEVYDLIFIRIYADLEENALSRTTCANHRLLKRQGDWYVFQKISEEKLSVQE